MSDQNQGAVPTDAMGDAGGNPNVSPAAIQGTSTFGGDVQPAPAPGGAVPVDQGMGGAAPTSNPVTPAAQGQQQFGGDDQQAKVKAYISGQGAMPKNQYDQLRQQIEASGVTDPNDVTAHAIAVGGSAAFQASRQHFDAAKGYAINALQNDNNEVAADAINKAFQFVPDGTKAMVTANKDGFSVSIHPPSGGEVQNFSVAPDQMKEVFTGPNGLYDHMVGKGVANVIQQSTQPNGEFGGPPTVNPPSGEFGGSPTVNPPRGEFGGSPTVNPPSGEFGGHPEGAQQTGKGSLTYGPNNEPGTGQPADASQFKSQGPTREQLIGEKPEAPTPVGQKGSNEEVRQKGVDEKLRALKHQMEMMPTPPGYNGVTFAQSPQYKALAKQYDDLANSRYDEGPANAAEKGRQFDKAALPTQSAARTSGAPAGGNAGFTTSNYTDAQGRQHVLQTANGPEPGAGPAPSETREQRQRQETPRNIAIDHPPETPESRVVWEQRPGYQDRYGYHQGYSIPHFDPAGAAGVRNQGAQTVGQQRNQNNLAVQGLRNEGTQAVANTNSQGRLQEAAMKLQQMQSNSTDATEREDARTAAQILGNVMKGGGTLGDAIEQMSGKINPRVLQALIARPPQGQQPTQQQPTQQQPTQQQQQQPQEEEAAPAPQDPADRQAGKEYNTPKGRLRWTGTGWVTPK